MKKGDRVLIVDGSYSWMQEGSYEGHTSGNALKQDGEYEVLEIGQFPCETENGFAAQFGFSVEINDLKLRCVKNPDRVVYTQRRFCSVVQPMEAK